MKNLLGFSLFLSMFVLTWAQDQQIYTSNKVHKMPAFPGCEGISLVDKTKVSACISQQLNEMLANELKDFDQVLVQSGIYNASAILQFVLSKEGIIHNISALKGSNPILADAGIMALENISQNIPPIQSAKLKNGTSVNMIFQIPINFIIEKPTKEEENFQYPVDEIVLFTLKQTDSPIRYEVRLFKNKDVKVYEINQDQVSYLGKYLTINEVEKSDPYKSLIALERASNKTLVTEGVLDNQLYEVYIHNLFKKSNKTPIYVEVMKVEKNKRTSVAKFEKEADFNQSKYASLIYRD